MYSSVLNVDCSIEGKVGVDVVYLDWFNPLWMNRGVFQHSKIRVSRAISHQKSILQAFALIQVL